MEEQLEISKCLLNLITEIAKSRALSFSQINEFVTKSGYRIESIYDGETTIIGEGSKTLRFNAILDD